MVVELVVKHAVSISELVEDAGQMRRERRPRQRTDQGASLPVQLGAMRVAAVEASRSSSILPTSLGATKAA